MGLFKKNKVKPVVTFEEEKQFVIEWLRNLDSKEYDKVLKIVEIYREADEKVKVVELGSKKAVREAEKEVIEEKELNEKVLENLLEN